MSPGATLTKEAPDALRTPDGLLPPVSDVGRTQGRRQDDFTFKPSGRRATKRSSDHAPAPAPPLDRKPISFHACQRARKRIIPQPAT